MLAGRMKLKHFLALVVLSAAGVGVAYYAFRRAALPPPPPSGISPVETATREPPSIPRIPEAPAPPPETAEIDSIVLGWLARDLGSDKKKDVTEGRRYKVNVYQDGGEAVANRAKVDLDRDERWDEKWTRKGDRISKQVAPADDEQYTETYEWHGEWVKTP